MKKFNRLGKQVLLKKKQTDMYDHLEEFECLQEQVNEDITALDNHGIQYWMSWFVLEVR